MPDANPISNIKLSEINLSDTTYSYHYKTYNQNALLRSIRESGVRTPVQVEKTTSGYRVIHGFRRIACSKELDYFEIPAQISAQDPFMSLKISLLENRVQSEFNLYEQSKCIHVAHDLGLSTSVIIEELLPLLGLNPHKNVYDSYRGFIFLPEPLIEFFVEKGIAISRTQNFQRLDDDGLQISVEILEKLNPGINVLDEIITHIFEISKNEDTSISEAFDSLKLRSILESKQPPHLQLAKIRQRLFEQRYPILNRTNQEIHEIVDKLDLPDAQTIRWDKKLETRGVNVSFHWETVDDIHEAVQSLSHPDNLARFKILFQNI
ncbi:MAG: hypothetical protein GF372_01600 [Candidatus Marinimicrobia bacterium]|nr:hypothetical protein [Candidatus Neomarinimicrobiota bacterium]